MTNGLNPTKLRVESGGPIGKQTGLIRSKGKNKNKNELARSE